MDMQNAVLQHGLEELSMVHNNVDRRNNWEQIAETVNEKLRLGENKEELSIEDINQTRKKKMDYRLYPLFQLTQGMLDKNRPVIDELFAEEADDTGEMRIIQTQTAKVFSEVSKDKAKLIQDIFDTWVEVKDLPETLRKGFIKDKVSQTRYSKKGQEYVMKFEEASNLAFSLSALVIEFKVQLNSLIENNGGIDVECIE